MSHPSNFTMLNKQFSVNKPCHKREIDSTTQLNYKNHVSPCLGRDNFNSIAPTSRGMFSLFATISSDKYNLIIYHGSSQIPELRTTMSDSIVQVIITFGPDLKNSFASLIYVSRLQMIALEGFIYIFDWAKKHISPNR